MRVMFSGPGIGQRLDIVDVQGNKTSPVVLGGRTNLTHQPPPRRRDETREVAARPSSWNQTPARLYPLQENRSSKYPWPRVMRSRLEIELGQASRLLRGPRPSRLGAGASPFLAASVSVSA